MMLDPIDGVILRRWQATTPAPERAAAAETVPPLEWAPETVAERPMGRNPAASDSREPVVDRLLAAAWPQWNAVADRVEAARSRGCRVVAVAGNEPREGRTTLVDGLARVLRDRGREVICTDPVDLATAALCGSPHDKRVVLVDAGVWFPPGPPRRQLLAIATRGCDAALLTRRADRPAVSARETLLEALGVEVLGEVVTFAPPEPSPRPTPPAAATRNTGR